MAVFYEVIPESLIAWVLAQKVFWVSTAPLSGDGHVNVSPKGGQYFGMKDRTTFWYMDLTGSGCETISHLIEPGNGRITILFNAFTGPPRILRFWGKGRVLENGTSAFDEIVKDQKIECIPGTRSIIVVDIHQVATSCGFSVPYFDFKEYRPTLNDFFAKKEEKFLEGNEKESMDRYWAYKNAWSVDGMPGMQRGLTAAKEHAVEPMKKFVGAVAPKLGQYRSKNSSIQQILIILLSVLVVILAVTHPALQSLHLKQLRHDAVAQIKAVMPLVSPRAMRR